MTAAHAERGRALSALNAIPASCDRPTWVKVAAAAKAAGLELRDFDAWSATAESYDPRAARDVWRSLKPDGGIGPGTLYHVAHEYGWAGNSSASKSASPNREPRQPARRTESPVPSNPIPNDAPPPPAQHPTLGVPSASWTYRDAKGRPLLYVYRFDTAPGAKEFRPLTYREGRWCWRGPNSPRPLYGLDRLAERPDALVIVAEGEKAADAAERLVPGAVAVASMNGAEGARAADWSPLARRRLILWPDADEPGMGYVAAVAELARAAGAKVAGVVNVNALAGHEPTPGWDAADAEAAGIAPLDASKLPLLPAPVNDNAEEAPLADRLTAALTPFTTDELEAAREPWPHTWSDGERGLFPVGEVSVIAAPGREGKTFATVALAGALGLNLHVAGLAPRADASAVILSAEDDRAQYARKVAAWAYRLGRDDAERVRRRIIVPDLTTEALAPLATVVTVLDRAPIETGSIDAAIAALDAVAPLLVAPVGLLIFETASTLSDAEEDNRGFRVLIRALRRIARALGVAVVLVHHTSQAAASHLPELNLSIADMRGGTALAFNSRQNFVLVNLGSATEPFPESDARAVLRGMLAPTFEGRVATLIPLDSSKSADPAPVVFGWHATPYGPSLGILPVPREVAGLPWRALQSRLRGERAERRAAARDDAKAASVARVVEIVARLNDAGKAATARAVSMEAGHSPGWAAPYLSAAVDSGELEAQEERVPRSKSAVTVYRLSAHSSEYPL